MTDNEISRHVVEAALEVQQVLGGPGLLESVYEEALAEELLARGLAVRRQVALPVLYKGKPLQTSFRLDLLVEEQVIVECKAASRLSDICASQILTYLRCSNKKLGLIINFGQRPLRQGIKRVVNGLDEYS